MRSRIQRLVLAATFLLLCAASWVDAEQLAATKPVFVHYMPWYATKAVSGEWGYHWTMNHFDPEERDDAGRRQIASHDAPLIGPYDSNDADALRCHVELMKATGIDGVIIDWYGIKNSHDYAMIHRNTLHLIRHLKQAGLQFAICYEDQTIGHMIRSRDLETAAAVTHGEEVMAWMESNWFHDSAYAKVDGRPLLFVFGPVHFAADDWKQLTAIADPVPLLLGLPHLTESHGCDGAFGWPPLDGGKECKPVEWKAYLHGLYDRAENEPTVAVAFPGFRDIYSQAKQKKSFGSIEYRDGKTFAETFDLAVASKAPIIQVATWNDFGEGTCIEPTVRAGYSYLEKIQRYKNPTATPASLRVPIERYRRNVRP